jgi:nitrogen regulatory protein PII
MTPVKRIEMVVTSLAVPRFTDALVRAGVMAWTVVRDVSGVGEGGVRGGDELTDLDRNSLILTACPPELLERVVEEVRPLLGRFGGMCLVSDAQWVVH